VSSCGVKRIPTMSLRVASVPPLMPCDKKRMAFAMMRFNRWGPVSDLSTGLTAKTMLLVLTLFGASSKRPATLAFVRRTAAHEFTRGVFARHSHNPVPR